MGEFNNLSSGVGVASGHYVGPYAQAAALGEIEALPEADCADVNCALFCWIVWPSMITEALMLIDPWNFNYKTCAFCPGTRMKHERRNIRTDFSDGVRVRWEI